MPLNINIQQILLHMLNVTVLFMILYFLLYRPVKEFIEKRTARYEEKEKQIADKMAEAEQLKEKYEKLLADAEIAADKIKEKAEAEAQEMMKEVLGRADREADRILQTARTGAQKEHDRMLQKAQEDISEMVTKAVGEIVFDNSSDAFDDFLDTVEKK